MGQAQRYRFAGFSLDPGLRTLDHAGTLVELRPTLFDVLVYLVEHHGRIVSKDELLDKVWAGRTVEESNLSQSVFGLRAALKASGGDAAERLILTVRGRGYRFIGDVDLGEALALPTMAAPAGLIVDESRSGRWAVWLAVVAGASGIAGVAGWRSLSAPQLAAGNTIVLADFDNRTHETVFDRTLASVLRIDLGQSPYLTVMPDKQARDTLTLMKRPAETPLTGRTAEEVCARNNADAVLAAALDSIGGRYMLTMSATDCAGQKTLAGAKIEVPDRAEVVPALDQLLGQMRSKLGEPVASVARFNVPLAPEKTASLDALKAYSEGLWLNEHGRRNEAEPAFRHAAELDPDLASAYVSLAVIYGGTNEDKLAADAIAKAYALRGTLNERQQLSLTVLYNQLFRKDFTATIRALRLLTTIYPNDAKAWGNLANVENVLGNYQEAIGAARRAVALKPKAEQPYAVLARAELRAGRPGIARAVGAEAVKLGLAGDATHGILLATAAMQRDRAGMARELSWARGTPGERILLVIQAQLAFAEGKVRIGEALFDQSAALSRQQGVPDFARAYRARLLIDLGQIDRAQLLLKGVTDKDDDDLIFATAEIGSPNDAERLLAAQIKRNPAGTLILGDFAPEIGAALALRREEPRAAVAALQPALPLQSRTFDIPYVLGRAYLAAGDGAHAAAAFQRIRAHQGWYPESPLYPLATLQLARSLKLAGDGGGAQRAYATFLDGWKEADPDLPLLHQARAEYAALRPMARVTR